MYIVLTGEVHVYVRYMLQCKHPVALLLLYFRAFTSTKLFYVYYHIWWVSPISIINLLIQNCSKYKIVTKLFKIVLRLPCTFIVYWIRKVQLKALSSQSVLHHENHLTYLYKWSICCNTNILLHHCYYFWTFTSTKLFYVYYHIWWVSPISIINLLMPNDSDTFQDHFYHFSMFCFWKFPLFVAVSS